MHTAMPLPAHAWVLTRRAALLFATALAVLAAAVAVAATLMVVRPGTPAAPARPVPLTMSSDGCPSAHPGQPC